MSFSIKTTPRSSFVQDYPKELKEPGRGCCRSCWLGSSLEVAGSVSRVWGRGPVLLTFGRRSFCGLDSKTVCPSAAAHGILQCLVHSALGTLFPPVNWMGELFLFEDCSVSETGTLSCSPGYPQPLAYLWLIKVKAEAVWKSRKNRDVQVDQV